MDAGWRPCSPTDLVLSSAIEVPRSCSNCFPSMPDQWRSLCLAAEDDQSAPGFGSIAPARSPMPTSGIKMRFRSRPQLARLWTWPAQRQPGWCGGRGVRRTTWDCPSTNQATTPVASRRPTFLPFAGAIAFPGRASTRGSDHSPSTFSGASRGWRSRSMLGPRTAASRHLRTIASATSTCGAPGCASPASRRVRSVSERARWRVICALSSAHLDRADATCSRYPRRNRTGGPRAGSACPPETAPASPPLPLESRTRSRA